MDALSALHDRVSSSRVGEQAPKEEVLHNIFRSALRAADHGLLRPWRFLVIRDDARHRLASLMQQAALAAEPGLPQAKLESIAAKALRAPVIVVAICSPKPHPKVPVWEQELSTGAAVQNMLNAAFAQQVGAIWRTGPMVEAVEVCQGLGLQGEEKIVGFLYLGPVSGELRPAPELAVDEYFREWE